MDIAAEIESTGHRVADLVGDHRLLDTLRRALTTADRLVETLRHLHDALVKTATHHGAGSSTSAPAEARPPALPKPPVPGRTHGQWVDRNGDTVALVNGKNGAYYETAKEQARRLGLTQGRPTGEAAIARHVEVQFACRMAAEGLRDETIEINRPVCGTTPNDRDRPNTCDRWLDHFLPEGSTLTVKDGTSPEGRRYRGRTRT
ncbi:SCP1.201-like deaminase [Actinokineospora auranticolor]|uniref:DddA-like double-stranded DNA deaminase toxin n=1 Tax=Actinokineospora auranticolor TaxID=155976 RepID=UPI001CA57427|nr:DddA-like double-stranded DNA deaminase toxin [Actinokineospora auranticolor]